MNNEFNRKPACLHAHTVPNWKALASTEKKRPAIEQSKAPPVENFAWLPVGVVSAKPARGSVSLIEAGFQVGRTGS